VISFHAIGGRLACLVCAVFLEGTIRSQI
jgi:hypothetical protein